MPQVPSCTPISPYGDSPSETDFDVVNKAWFGIRDEVRPNAVFCVLCYTPLFDAIGKADDTISMQSCV